MKPVAFVCLSLSLWPGLIQAAPRHEPGDIIRSRTDQFIVHRWQSVAPKSQPKPDGEQQAESPDWIRLEPAPLAVSCERIKNALLRQIDLTDRWRAKIHVEVDTLADRTENIQITSTRFRDGWQYHLTLTETVEKQKLVRALVQVILLEIANRSSSGRCAEIPVWLTEGLTLMLTQSALADLALRPDTPVVRVRVRYDPLAAARRYFQDHAPLSFKELSMPEPKQLTGETWKNYRFTAQLFLHELLQFNDGRRCLRQMLSQLPYFWNWQLAFLQAFNRHFERMLDVEKWWELNLVDFTGRDQWKSWPREISLEKFADVLQVPVQVRSQANELPQHTEVNLQSVVKLWNNPAQHKVLQYELQQLQSLRVHMDPKLYPLLDDYIQTLKDYLDQLPRIESGEPNAGRSPLALPPFVQDALSQLNQLDQHRQSLKE